MTKHTFPAYAFCKQKRYPRRHLVKPRSMKLRRFISRLQELNAYLEEFPPETEGQETAPLIEKKFFKFLKNKKRRKIEKELQHFQEM